VGGWGGGGEEREKGREGGCKGGRLEEARWRHREVEEGGGLRGGRGER